MDAVTEPVTIDCLFVSGDPAENIRRSIALERSKQTVGAYSAEALRAATLSGICEGYYRVEKRELDWNFTPQQRLSYPSR